jgi:hypothetical protein
MCLGRSNLISECRTVIGVVKIYLSALVLVYLSDFLGLITKWFPRKGRAVVETQVSQLEAGSALPGPEKSRGVAVD